MLTIDHLFNQDGEEHIWLYRMMAWLITFMYYILGSDEYIPYILALNNLKNSFGKKTDIISLKCLLQPHLWKGSVLWTLEHCQYRPLIYLMGKGKKKKDMMWRFYRLIVTRLQRKPMRHAKQHARNDEEEGYGKQLNCSPQACTTNKQHTHTRVTHNKHIQTPDSCL